ncbi:MAG: DMT family transporter [Desulfovibrio desulfuricans]|nr:DMT family transporter [Desulfovibrio desulfuricans]
MTFPRNAAPDPTGSGSVREARRHPASPGVREALTTALLTALVMTLFAANSLLCRFALDDAQGADALDPAAYTALRALSGAVMLRLLLRRRKGARLAGSWGAALALFGYMACFSWAYIHLSAAAGALIIAVAVQAGMLAAGIHLGQTPDKTQALGIALALAGLVWLLLPGLDAPAPVPAAIMYGSGTCWAVYTVLGRGLPDPEAATAGNFARCVPLAALTLAAAALWGDVPPVRNWPWQGVVCALAAGALASALGYALWYAVLQKLSMPVSAVAQLSVPLITAVGGALLLGEALTLRVLASGAAILGGIFCATALPHLLCGVRAPGGKG